MLAAALVCLLGPLAAARAAAPIVAISNPATGSATNNQTPAFEGTTNDNLDSVTLAIYQGITATGTPVQTLTSLLPPAAGTWTIVPATALEQGTYTAVAEQKNLLLEPTGTLETGLSAPVTFTVDTTPPVVTLNAIATPTNNPTPTLTGTAGTLAGDSATITLTIYNGTTITGTIASTETVPTTTGTWTHQTPHLADGTYTAQATQSDTANNHGTSTPVTFTVDTTPPNVGISTPADGAFLNTHKPTFSGIAGNATGDEGTVTLNVYEGTTTSGSPTQTVEITRTGAAWTTGSTGPQLPDGTYTARVTQKDTAGNLATSAKHTFTIKTNAPVVTLTPPGAVIGDATPTFKGSAATAAGDSASVKLKVYRGTSTSGGAGNLAEAAITVPVSGGSWATGRTPHLADGTYTAQVEQEDSAANVGVSAAATFRVDTTPPAVTLTTPVNGSVGSGESQAAGGAAGTAPGDFPEVTVRLFAGTMPLVSQVPLESITVNSTHGYWSATFGGLSPGLYTVRAEQADNAGNLGLSATSTFEVPGPAPVTTTTTGSTTTTPASPTPAPAPPSAAFVWFPSNPHTGERVSLASSSTDAGSPIAALEWDLAGNGAFLPGNQVISTSFATPGNHLVRLRVTDAGGRSSIASETVVVTPPSLSLMQPFPIVRIAGAYTATGVNLNLLTVQMPAGATVTLRCRGRGCPARSESRVTTMTSRKHGGTVTVAFKRFERYLRAGVVVELRVSKQGEIGKYTRFAIRHGRPPERSDACVAYGTSKPIACPNS